MPIDKNGNLLKVGDHVVIHAVITHVAGGSHYANCTLVTDSNMFPGNEPVTLSTLNTQQVELIDSVPDATPKRTGYALVHPGGKP